MPHWVPNQEWKDEDVYIIGGGVSLESFDWELIKGKRTIGCNSAYILGHEICNILVFGDVLWWEKIGRKGTQEFGGIVVGCVMGAKNLTREPWLLTMPRHGVLGFGTKALGFFGNTGGLAINLALILGAKRVFLLGFDMHLSENRKANWHDVRYEPARADVYKRFCNEFRRAAGSLEKVFPGREIWNVTDDSDLNEFPKVSIAEHFNLEGAK